MIEHLPVLVVVTPLLAAPVTLLVRRGGLVRVWSLLVASATFGGAVALLRQVLDHGTVSYAVGGWPPPLGIEYRVGLANAFVLVAVSFIGLVVLGFDTRASSSRLDADRRYLYYSAYLLCLAGLLGMAVTGDAFNIFVFLEISSLSSYALISMGKERRALTAAFSYLIIGTIGGVFVLLGIGMLYAMTGTLNLADLAARFPAIAGSRTAVVAFGFFTVGLSIKLAVFPLHQWLPNAYSFAPPKVSAFLAGTATKVSYWVLVRMVFTVFGTGFVFGSLHFELFLVPLSLLGMFIGSLAAIYQNDLRRLLAYSSIAQVGYMTLGISLNNAEGLTGSLVHLFNHGVTKSGLFLAIACLGYRLGSERIDGLAGAGRRAPIAAFAFVVGGLSLIGVPGTAGFVSKWYLVLGALERGWWWLALMVLISSLLAVAYVWRFVEVAYFRQPLQLDLAQPRFEPPGMLIPTIVLIGATVVFGFWTDLTVGIVRPAVELLLGGTL
ncbi:MAG TPA: monovalent cation/H+ antiporter subunit D family protein [Thermoanaerobaculia bacterium]|nr:monovalent cation/H+ antiporter subunit D family protein [Thermoanaerobaculia bacterium]